MDRAPVTSSGHAAFRFRPASAAHDTLAPAQSAALRRARELAAELAELTAAVRAHLAAQAAAQAAAPEVAPEPAPPREPEPAPERVPEEEGEAKRLKAGDMRDAFRAARLDSADGPRPRWADTLLSE